jgi:hypothetical protein
MNRKLEVECVLRHTIDVLNTQKKELKKYCNNNLEKGQEEYEVLKELADKYGVELEEKTP